MTLARTALGALGLAGVAWGAWLFSDDGVPQLLSVLLWVAGGVLVHDALVGPLTVLVGAVALRRSPPSTRRAVASVLVVWATTSVAVANVLSGQGGRPDNPTILTGDYRVWWAALTAVAVVAVVVLLARGRRRAEVVDGPEQGSADGVGTSVDRPDGAT